MNKWINLTSRGHEPKNDRAQPKTGVISHRKRDQMMTEHIQRRLKRPKLKRNALELTETDGETPRKRSKMKWPRNDCEMTDNRPENRPEKWFQILKMTKNGGKSPWKRTFSTQCTKVSNMITIVVTCSGRRYIYVRNRPKNRATTRLIDGIADVINWPTKTGVNGRYPFGRSRYQAHDHEPNVLLRLCLHVDRGCHHTHSVRRKKAEEATCEHV